MFTKEELLVIAAALRQVSWPGKALEMGAALVQKVEKLANECRAGD